MKLPNYQNAEISDSKLLDYCLNPKHPIGKHKAVIFKKVLGITAHNFQELKNAIRTAIGENDCIPDYEDLYGKRFVLDFIFTKFGKESEIRTCWIIKKGEHIPVLVTCYVKAKP